MSSDFDATWQDWLENVGVDIDIEVEENLERYRFMLDMDDGTHAQWRGGQLGVLLLMDEEEVHALVDARRRATSESDLEAWVMVCSWAMGFTLFLDQCLEMKNLMEDDDL